MRVYAFPARYATEIARTLDVLKASVRADALMGGEDSPWPNGIIPKDDREGTLMILVADVERDGASPVFPLEQAHIEAERKAS